MTQILELVRYRRDLRELAPISTGQLGLTERA